MPHLCTFKKGMGMVYKRKVLITALLSAFSSAGFAADEVTTKSNEQITTERIVVKGILPEKLESVPGAFNVIDEEDLIERRPFSMREALNNIPGINIVGEDAFALRANIGMRGLDPRRSSRTLMMEDGMPLFLAPYGDPSAHFLTPLQRVQRIEVVKGSGQILYGPQTIGGMINFVTRPVPTDGKLHGAAEVTIGNNDFSGLYANIGYGDERGGIMIDALQNKGDGIRRDHDFDVKEFTIKGQLNLTDRQTLIAKVGYLEEKSHQSETGLGELDYARDKFQAPTGNNDLFDHDRKTAHLQHIFQISDKAKLSTQAYYVDTFRNSYRQTDAPGRFSDDNPGRSTGITRLDRCNRDAADNPDGCGGRHRPRDYQYFGFEPRLDFQHELFGLKSDAVIGFRYHEEDIKRRQFRGSDPRIQSLSFAKVNGEFREDIAIEVEAKSYYFQNTFYAGDFSITPGFRYEDINIKTDIRRAGSNPQNNPESDSTNRQREMLPGLGVAWNGIANTTVFAGIHKGFAPPRPDRDITVPGANQARVDQTRPETSTNYEIGFRSSFFKGINFESTLFHTKVDDLVINNGLGSFINAAKTEQSGLEFGGRIDFGAIYDTPHNIYLQGSYTNLFTAEFKSNGLRARDGIVDGDRLPYAPRHMASINLGYEHPIGFDARFGIDYVSRQEPDAFARALNVLDPSGRDTALSGLAGDIPAYTLLNFTANYRPIGSKASYFVSAFNLADREYLASRVDGMAVGRGRQVLAGVRYNF